MIYTCTLNPALDKIGQVSKVQFHQINRLSRMESAAGGKGILVSKGIRALNHDSIAVGFLGGSIGSYVEMLLKRDDLHYHMIDILGNTRTNLKIIDEQGMSEFNEPGPFILSDELEALYDYFRSHLDQRSILVISGSMPNGCGIDTYANLIQIAHDNGSIVFLDTNYDCLVSSLNVHPNIVKLKSKDLARYFQIEKDMTDEEIKKYGQLFIQDNCDMLCVSCDTKGIFMVTSQKMLHCLPLNLEMKSRLGVGDAFVSGFVVGLENNMSDEEVLRLAGASYAAASQKANAQVRDCDEILKYMDIVKIEYK
ncbi:MAG: 1-phosphofructokinase family hexose kinase [Traorella sp.]